MQDHMVMLKSREEPTPTKVLVAGVNWGETKEQGHKNSETKETTGEAERSSEGIQRKAGSRWPATEDRAAKIERLKSGFQICKPQGTFIWPKMAIMSPQDVVQLDDHIGVPTPSSACSSSLPEVSKPSSFFRPLAERRPISSTTLTHVTMSVTPFLSPQPSGTPSSQKTGSHNPPLINLNEAPPKYDPSS